MHILVTNDDGPPSAESSPYILPFVRTLEAAGHTVSVIIPDSQRSWIGKAHIVGQDVRTEAYWPPETNPGVHSTTSATPRTTGQDGTGEARDGRQPWVLVSSTPATCAQLGLGSLFFTSRGPIDLVISGPNYGRNTTAVFALSSGTLGAALEAAACGYRAIALSFAFFDRVNDPEIVGECCRHAVKVCEHLAAKAAWGEGKLYSVNVPVLKGVEGRKVVWTRVLQNVWGRGACFAELPDAKAGEEVDAETEEVRIRRRESGGAEEKEMMKGPKVDGEGVGGKGEFRTRHFKWSPRYKAHEQNFTMPGIFANPFPAGLQMSSTV
ncbi:uncharacterized protein LTR77_007193 [Saxophila tyrrhenica]|uniref:Survival protein SurE-like phosphatase/nucleotidase domain-containing protein n=1 Tax=Saxophila tyrrhenica TaxID=1690608 RepID=A0AAV9P6Z1_9PEZI|nr:hypothetical protein LTR77_007193 [Saxophila tyrrhenica]